MNAPTVCPKCHGQIPDESPQALCPRCALTSAVQTEPPPSAERKSPEISTLAREFPLLEVIELIGQGGMGFVYRARQLKLDRLVALKILAAPRDGDPAFAERFHREAKVLAKLNHPHIVAVHDFGQTASFFFLLMEYVDGVNLRQAMVAGRFSPSEALLLIPQLCDAIQYAHEEGVLHRDIKPENILIDSRGRMKIADFGIAKLVHEDPRSITLTVSGATLGTPHYMAPEQVEHPEKVDHRADIYSLGVVFYEMLTAELPIGRFAPPSEKSNVSTKVDDVVLRTLEKERGNRYQTAREFKQGVEGIGVHEKAPTPPVTPSLPIPNELALARWNGIALVGFVIAAIAWLQFIVITFGDDRGDKMFSVVPLAALSVGMGCLSLRWFNRNYPGRAGHRWALLSTIFWPALLALVAVARITHRGVIGFAPPLAAGVMAVFLVVGILLAKHLTLKFWNYFTRQLPVTPLFWAPYSWNPSRWIESGIILIAVLMLTITSANLNRSASSDVAIPMSVVVSDPNIYFNPAPTPQPNVPVEPLPLPPTHVATRLFVLPNQVLTMKYQVWIDGVSIATNQRVVSIPGLETDPRFVEIGHTQTPGDPCQIQHFFRIDDGDWQGLAATNSVSHFIRHYQLLKGPRQFQPTVGEKVSWLIGVGAVQRPLDSGNWSEVEYKHTLDFHLTSTAPTNEVRGSLFTTPQNSQVTNRLPIEPTPAPQLPNANPE